VGSRPGKEVQVPAAPASTATSPAGPSAVIVTATVTATPPPAAAPLTSTVIAATTPPATAPRPESIAGVVRHDVDCDHSHVVVLASALNRSDFESAAIGLGAKYPAAKFLISGSSCLNFRSQSAYVLYLGSYPTVSDACAARFAGTRDAYVKVADPAVTDRAVSCLCPPPGQPPDLGSGSEGPYVTEAQYALQRLGFYAGDGTGVFDADTEQAVRALQSGKSLPVDGRLTAATWSALTAADCAG
ncbi:MAG TPA: peptidoglycan-binding domain-containing protein, partial [Nakamurella sp.]